MQACNGDAAVMGSLQQPVWIKTSNSQVGQLKPCRASHIEGSLATGGPTSSVSSTVSDYDLSRADPQVYGIIGKEKERQFKSLELIASESFTLRAVMEAVGSCLTNKYNEGLPGKRYHGGSEHIDELETLCQHRALEAFHLDKEIWGVNVQPLSGSPANFAVYTAILKPHDRIMGFDLPHGGACLMTAKRRVSGTSIYFEPMPHGFDEFTAFVSRLCRRRPILFRPKLIIAGASGYPRDFDYPRMRKCPVSIWKLLSTMPSSPGGPHNHTIGGLAVCLKHAQSPEFKSYQNRGLDGARVEMILDMASITHPQQELSDKSALVPGGIRIVSPAMTTTGFSEKEFKAIADFIHEGVQITLTSSTGNQAPRLF
uniref:Serine hydroxymethyltransferase-like domain-containing protein n=1 Tax=Kalanchoe fedtschenkoi TaxID=63787 RepID=A0A7N1A6U5_KALFE